MRILLVLGAVLGGVAFWRRKSLKDDATKVTDVAKGGVERIKSGSSEAAADVAEDASETATDAAKTAEAAADEAADDAADA